ncbi:GNAT family N-acetyltransferase [Nakamurella endophytica]|uniref:GNAT family N-acetyltransferase n=1 Tax=Nakamurella endophytica TaxID=1748367 RepID=A0A917SNG1_9ACTN|nr:GNAT family N-acyltransferase [Nakamurella endophytica]GGL89341.1 hypothetical protein GCM10011594_06160 [Nakamurella endophytica]
MSTITDEPRVARQDTRFPGRYELRVASTAAEVLAAAALRHRVFAQECGAVTPGPDGVDLDRFDVRCDHLVVWHLPEDGSPEQAVATYRLLLPSANHRRPRRQGLYANTEFDLAPLESLLDTTVEAGRACVAAEHRGSRAISLLWSGIARAMLQSGSRYLVGCASIPVADGGGQAALFERMARDRHWAPAERQCAPRHPYRASTAPPVDRLRIPPLLHGYLRLGAQICSAPAHDEQFGSADFLVLLDLQQADPRYLRYFVQDALIRP